MQYDSINGSERSVHLAKEIQDERNRLVELAKNGKELKVANGLEKCFIIDTKNINNEVKYNIAACQKDLNEN